MSPFFVAGHFLCRLEDADPLLEPAGDFGDGRFARDFFVLQIHDGVQKTRSPDGETDKAGNRGGDAQPLDHLLFVLAAAEHDAADLLAAFAAGGLDQCQAVFAAVEPLDLPDVGLDAGVLQLVDRAAHQVGTQLQVVGLLVAADLGQLRRLGRNEQLEHEEPIVDVQIVGDPFQPGRLPAIGDFVPLGIVADQDLGELGIEGFDVAGELIAILEIEFVLTAFFGRQRELKTAAAGVLQNGRCRTPRRPEMPLFSGGTPAATAAM